MGTFHADPFQEVATWSEDTARAWADRLDQRAASPDQVALRAAAVAAAGLTPGDLAVEVGCGTGPLLADLLPAVGLGGRLVGVDPQRTLARLARDRFRGHPQVSVAVGTGGRLPVRSGAAAACLAQTVLLHVPPPDLAGTIAEMVRVVRPGGRVLSIDQDVDTWVIEHPDKETTRRLLRFNTDTRYGDGWTARRLPALFRAAGLRDVGVGALTHIDTERGSHLHGSALRMVASATGAGLLDAAAAARWTAQLEEADGFFSALTFYRCTGRT